jgi:hypothetical protein
MQLRRIGNTNAVEVSPHAELDVLFSYSTMVAAWVSGKGYFKTAKFHSMTTTRHINKWVKGGRTPSAVALPQEDLEELVKREMRKPS